MKHFVQVVAFDAWIEAESYPANRLNEVAQEMQESRPNSYYFYDLTIIAWN